MRSELKVGIAVGLVVIGGGIIFFVSQGRKAGGTADVIPMTAPVETAAPSTAKPAEKRPTAPPRTADRPTAGEHRPIITPPPARTPSPTTQPAVARPTPTPAGAPRTGEPTTSPLVRHPIPTPEPEPATQPRVMPELPPLAAAGEPTDRPATPAAEPIATPLVRTTPAVTPPARSETEAPAATPVAPQPRTPAAVRKYTVAEGETLWSIAEEQYGDPHLWRKILAANPGMDERVNAGQVINLPPKEDVLVPAATPTARPAPGAGEAKPTTETRDTRPAARAATYVVEKNDTLYSIAAKVLGDGNRWREIFELNKDKLARPEALKIGMELKLPAK